MLRKIQPTWVVEFVSRICQEQAYSVLGAHLIHEDWERAQFLE
jgi:hypothetical protein